MKADFAHRLQLARAGRRADRALLIAPHLPQMPLPMLHIDDPFLPFGKAVIDATHDLVRAYVFDFAAYLAIGAAGAIALERTAAYVGQDNLTVMHARFAGPGYVATAEAFGVDAVTLADEGYMDTYHAAGLGVLDVDSPNLVGEGIEIPLYGEDVLHVGRGEDFAEQVRKAQQTFGTSS